MRIKMIESVGEYAAGKEYDVPASKEANVKRYVTAGMAEVVPDPPSELIDETLKKTFREMGKELLAGLTDGAKASSRPVIHQGDYTSVEEPLSGLKVFGSCGGFLHAVRAGTATNPDRDSVEKLAGWDDVCRKSGVFTTGIVSKAPSGNFEGNDPDGGALVIPEFAQQIVERFQAQENFLSETDQLTIRGNMLTMPRLDDKSRADGARSGGVIGAYADEAGALTNVSKVQFGTMDLRLKKLFVFCFMTDELLSDSAYALESYVAKKAAEELVFKVNDGLIRGTGAGQPLGALNAPCKIAVSKETGQAAASILNLNIEKMWMRFNAACRGNAVWLINQDTEAQLQTMALPIGIAGVPTYMPVGGVSNPSFATLKGRPVKPVEFCETLGTEGDIILIDWSKYQSIVKGGVKTDMSMHVRFQYGEMAYRFTYRFDAQPKWDTVLTPYKGSNTTSPIVTLATRS